MDLGGKPLGRTRESAVRSLGRGDDTPSLDRARCLLHLPASREAVDSLCSRMHVGGDDAVACDHLSREGRKPQFHFGVVTSEHADGAEGRPAEVARAMTRALFDAICQRHRDRGSLPRGLGYLQAMIDGFDVVISANLSQVSCPYPVVVEFWGFHLSFDNQAPIGSFTRSLMVPSLAVA